MAISMTKNEDSVKHNLPDAKNQIFCPSLFITNLIESPAKDHHVCTNNFILPINFAGMVKHTFAQECLLATGCGQVCA